MRPQPVDVPTVFAGHRVVPVVRIEYPEQARSLREALVEGGVRCAEITLRTPRALAAIEAMRADEQGFLVGAGTVLNASQARQSIAAGAAFLVSPGWDDGLVETAAEAGVPLLPGVATATEAQRAVNAGVEVVKFFPAETAGGVQAVQALSEPFRTLRFVPTGGITLANAPRWLAVPSVMAIGGTWLAPTELLKSRDFNSIAKIAKETTSALGQK